jgi:hypothetical protein
MKVINFNVKVLYLLAFFLIIWGCDGKIEEDPCLKTKWPKTKEFELKLAVHVMPANPNLPGGAPGSQNPVDFEKMVVSGTMEKIDCSEQNDSICNLGNSYITKGVDLPAPVNIPKAYWIGHVVYVYEFGNDKDHFKVNITVKITMQDNQSYMCNVSEEIYYPQVTQVPGEMYYYILLDIYSDNWIKV